MRAKNLAKLDALGRHTTVLVAPVDQRILQTKTTLKGKSWFLQAHGRCEPDDSLPSTPGRSSGEELGKDLSEMRAADFLGGWVDSNGNAIHVAKSGNGWMVATLSRPPLRQLRLNLWRSEGTSQWICGNARLGRCGEQLVWHFGSGRVSTWVRKRPLSGQSDSGDEAVPGKVPAEGPGGYGDWHDAPAPPRRATFAGQGRMDVSQGQVVTLAELTKMISDGTMETMMIPEKQEDGTVLLVSLTDKKLKQMAQH